jgi:hypothetical protein
LVSSTYMAGELRRYWALAAALAVGTGVGPVHPPVERVASEFTANLPCFSLGLGPVPGAYLFDLLANVQVAA